MGSAILRQLMIGGRVPAFIRIAAQAGLLIASGWLLKDPISIPVWQIGPALVLAAAGIAWMSLRERM